MIIDQRKGEIVTNCFAFAGIDSTESFVEVFVFIDCVADKFDFVVGEYTFLGFVVGVIADVEDATFFH